MKLTNLLAATALFTIASSSFAANPTSIVFETNSETVDGTPYAQYAVKCSNGKKVQVTAWDNRRQWCVGEASKQDCENKQIRAAKTACKAP